MLRITVDLVPFGDEARKRTVGEMIIGNIGEGTHEGHKYVWASREPQPLANCEKERQGIVDDYDRNASVWDLIAACLSHRTADGTETEKDKMALALTRILLDG